MQSPSKERNLRPSSRGLLRVLREAPPLHLLGVAVAALAMGAILLCLYGEQGSFAASLGQNLLSDAIMLVITLVVVERLLTADQHRRNQAERDIAYLAITPLYTDAYNFWCALVAISWDDLEFRDLSEEPFSERVKAKVERVGEKIVRHKNGALIAHNLSFRAAELAYQVERAIALYSGRFNPALLKACHLFLHSHFLRWAQILETELDRDPVTFAACVGGNLTWSRRQSIKLAKGVSIAKDRTCPQTVDENIGTILTEIRQQLIKLGNESADALYDLPEFSRDRLLSAYFLTVPRDR